MVGTYAAMWALGIVTDAEEGGTDTAKADELPVTDASTAEDAPGAATQYASPASML